MEKTSAEDDCVDSGAETGGSDYSPLSSTSIRGGELSMGEFQDPFLVCVHLIADPGQGKFLQRAADAVLAWVHPELQLFRISERASVSRPKHHHNGSPVAAFQPALAVIVFLQEAYGGEEQILMLHRAMQRPPWRYHHTEQVSNGRRMLPLTPCSQDFFTLSAGTPLWAVRQVHYGKEIVRFTVYCRHENYVDMVRLYKLLLQRRVAQKKEDFCFFVLYSNPDMEIQLSFKRLPRGQSPAALESAVMEVRVRDVGTLVPLLPRPCSPISEVRWQTEDYDGNKILLQVQGAHFQHQHGPCYISSSVPESASAPSTFTRSAASYRNRRHHHRVPSRLRVHQTSHSSHSCQPLACEEPEEPDESDPWRGPRSGSLFSLPNLGSASSTCSSPGLHHRSHSLTRSSSLVPPFRLNLDALIGAEETDVDTGDTVDQGGGVDLTVVSAYIRSSLPQTPRPLSAPPEDIGPSLSPGVPEKAYRAATLGRTPNSFRTISSASTLSGGSRIHGANSNAAPSLSDVSINQSDSCSIISAPVEEEDEEDEEEDQEFYI
ncbi:protein FAM124A isoform X3 [Sebastes umbrosus]|uniref:protein FAM124A isoform X3 n=1 Tax=Sebastes umbrosus TaxID=72105 RepID=UPI00189EF4A2|nr:protein FAM124A isoform X3 [Sebastes umbrosus]XP_037646527.1 protein FAM124A isoform X3 [Sebastes umbrosus]